MFANVKPFHSLVDTSNFRHNGPVVALVHGNKTYPTVHYSLYPVRIGILFNLINV